MAVFPPKDKLVTRRPSLKGLLMQDVSNGAERSRAWPRKRGKNLPPAQKERMEWFRQAQWATKYIEPSVMVAFAQATKGTPLLPRDLATMMFAGRFTTLILEDGRKVFSVQQLQDVSFSLDAISQTEGYQLIRGPTYWEGQPRIVGNRIGAKVTRAAATASFASFAWGTIIWTAEALDQGAFWDPANPTVITIPQVGWYQIKAQLIRNGTGNFSGDVRLVVNGVVRYTQRYTSTNSSGGANGMVDYFDYFQTGDQIVVQAQSQGVAATWSNSFLHIVGNA